MWSTGYGGGVTARFIDHDGSPVGMPFAISTGVSSEAQRGVFSLDVVFDGEAFVVVWLETWYSFPYSGASLLAQRVSVAGELIGERQVVSNQPLSDVRVATGGGSVLVAQCMLDYSTPFCSLYLATEPGGELELTDAMELDGLDLEHMALGFSGGAWLFALDGTYLRVSVDGTFVDDHGGREQTGVVELRDLLPSRGQASVDCSECLATGWFDSQGQLKDLAGQRISFVCPTCGGPGWTAPSVVLTESVLEAG